MGIVPPALLGFYLGFTIVGAVFIVGCSLLDYLCEGSKLKECICLIFAWLFE